MNRIRGQPRRDSFPARFIQDMAATAGVAVGHQVARSGATTTAPRRRALTVPRLLPRTVWPAAKSYPGTSVTWSRSFARLP